jgi:hypothetical protein
MATDKKPVLFIPSVVHGSQQPLAYNESVDEGVMDNPWI